MLSGEKISWIPGTPLGLDIRNLSFVAPHRHENLVEITLCLAGEIKFSYCFEEFAIKPGEFILVDKDVHYLHGGEATCASFYIDLNFFKAKYPYIDSMVFVCEGTRESTVPHDTYYHKYLKSILLAILFYVSGKPERGKNFYEKLIAASGKIIQLLIDHFDHIFYYQPGLDLKAEAMDRYHNALKYIYDHCENKMAVEELAAHCGISSAYMSEFFSKVSLGVRSMTGYMRAYKSEKYLMETDLSIVEISETCGFSDAKYYYETFKNWYHCTPGQFRRRFRNEMGRENREEKVPVESTTAFLKDMMDNHMIDMFL